MDSIFGIGTPELILILIIAGIVMGPERIGKAARWLGRATAQIQSISRGFVRQLSAEIDQADDKGELKSAMQDVQALRKQLAEIRGELNTLATSTAKETNQALRDTKRELKNSIAPPSLAQSDGKAEGEARNGRADTSIPEAADETPPVDLPTRMEISDDPE